MNKSLLKKHISSFITTSRKNRQKYQEDLRERLAFTAYYQSFTKEKILAMTAEDLFEYLSQLWAMLIWGNKHYAVDKIINENGLQNVREQLATLIWGKEDIAARWDNFRARIKGMGSAMISEILCKTHPNEYILWNRRAYVGLKYLGVEDLPRHDYQLNGSMYKYLCATAAEISKALKQEGAADISLLAVDYFIWDELLVEEVEAVEDNLDKIHSTKTTNEPIPAVPSKEESTSKHNDIRDKLKDIGQWLGFNSETEVNVSSGSRVDTIWEAAIGNMGRVIYVFEVQTRGSIDSLIVNLCKALNNPAVQGVVAVSDKEQLKKIENQAKGMKELKDKLKYWDDEEVYKVHENLEYVNSKINALQLVPEKF